MPREKTLIDLMAGLPADEVALARERNLRDLARARRQVLLHELQEEQFALIAAKSGKKPGRPGKLTADLVLDAAQRTESPMTAADVRETLRADDVDVTVNAVRNHLNALVTTGDLEKEDKKYVVSDPEPVLRPFVPGIGVVDDFPAAATADEDIPF